MFLTFRGEEKVGDIRGSDGSPELVDSQILFTG